jgi:peptide/nickel transport system ATP-binding protein
MNEAALLEVKGLRLSVATDAGLAQILDHVELSLARGRILGVVGESGCGKSTLARAILGILPQATKEACGEIVFEGENLLRLNEAEMTRRVRGTRIGFIPQDPYLALNPVFKIGAQLLPLLRWHAHARLPTARSRRAHLIELLRRVQIAEPAAALERYPHEFSGGQRQRLMIAGALACQPALIIADEPTASLDATLQLQILELLKSLSGDFRLAILFVTHDFGVVAELCDDITVMYAGQTVEAGVTAEVLAHPRHPYSKALLACHPGRAGALTGIPGLVASPLAPPPGCRFAPRCPDAIDACSGRKPRFTSCAPGHRVNCRLTDDGMRR